MGDMGHGHGDMGTWAMDGYGYGHATENDETVIQSKLTKGNI